MFILAELAGVVAEMILAYIYLNGFFPQRLRPWWAMWAAYLVSGGILAILSFVPDASFLRLAFNAAALGLIVYSFFNASILQAAYASISFSCLCVLGEMLTFGLFSLFRIDADEIMSYGHSRAICIIISHMLLWLCVLIVLAITKRKRTAITLPFLLTLTPGYIAGIVLGVSFCRQVLSGDDRMSVPVLVSAIGLLYLNIVIVLYAERAKNASDQKLQAELAEHHYAMQEQYYAQLRSEQEETRAMFHDINKYMQAMRTLAAEANAAEVNQMMAETQELFESLTTVVDVGNSVVSTILNEYREIAEDADTPFDFDVRVPQNLGIPAVDLYVLLGNTLDNAIEACQSLPAENRYIRLQMRTYHNIFFYRIENPYAEEYPRRSRGKNHGYGLQNVRRCVEKYSGDVSINDKDGTFILSLRLNNCVPLDCELISPVTSSKGAR